LARDGVRILSFDPQIIVCQTGVVNSRFNGRRHMLGAFQAVQRRSWLNRDTLHVWKLKPQTPCDSGEGSRRSYRGHKVRDGSTALLENLRPGRVEMGLPVRR